MKRLFLAGIGLLSMPATAEVVSSSANGFHIRHVVQVVTPTQVAYPAFTNVGAWWGKEHTYSGDAGNMSLVSSAGGCFCERVPKTGGSVEHMRVAYVEPGARIVMTGSLGPLLYEATAGVMDVKVERIAGGSRVTLDYKVAGFADGNAANLAPLVDSVLGDQMKRYRAFAVSRPKT
jgi:hypothetical protein